MRVAEYSDDEEYESSNTEEEEDYEIIVNQMQDTVRLPNGYMETGIKGALIQIELPQGNRNQHWRVLKLSTEKQMVAYPKSNLRLPTGLLQRMVKSFKGTEDDTYSPIRTSGEVKIFGMYMSPLLQTHVFVGLFTVTTGEGLATTPTNDKHKPSKRDEDQMSDRHTPTVQKQTEETLNPTL